MGRSTAVEPIHDRHAIIGDRPRGESESGIARAGEKACAGLRGLVVPLAHDREGFLPVGALRDFLNDEIGIDLARETISRDLNPVGRVRLCRKAEGIAVAILIKARRDFAGDRQRREIGVVLLSDHGCGGDADADHVRTFVRKHESRQHRTGRSGGVGLRSLGRLHRDTHAHGFERLTVDLQSLSGAAARKVATKEGCLEHLPLLTRRGEDRVDPRTCARGEKIGVFGSTIVEEIVNPDEVVAVGGGSEIDQGIASDLITAASEFTALGIGQGEGGISARVDSLGTAMDEDTLPFLQRNLPTVDLVRIGGAMGDGLERQGRGLRRIVVNRARVGEDGGVLRRDVEKARGGTSEIPIGADLDGTLDRFRRNGDAELLRPGNELGLERRIGKGEAGELLEIQSTDGDDGGFASADHGRTQGLQLGRGQLRPRRRGKKKGGENRNQWHGHPAHAFYGGRVRGAGAGRFRNGRPIRDAWAGSPCN